MKTAVFFDWDGTLVDSLDLLINAHNHVRGAYGLPLWSDEEFFGAVTYSARELYPTIYGDQADEARTMLFAYIRAHHLQHLKTMDGAKELLDELKALNVAMGVVSNKTNDILRAEVEAVGWQGYFPVYIGAGVATKDKPSADPLFHAMAQHPAKPTIGQMIYVGDTETDLKTCAAAQCDCAYIKQQGRDAKLVEIYKPVIEVNNLFELRQALGPYLKG